MLIRRNEKVTEVFIYILYLARALGFLNEFVALSCRYINTIVTISTSRLANEPPYHIRFRVPKTTSLKNSWAASFLCQTQGGNWASIAGTHNQNINISLLCVKIYMINVLILTLWVGILPVLTVFNKNNKVTAITLKLINDMLDPYHKNNCEITPNFCFSSWMRIFLYS